MKHLSFCVVLFLGLSSAHAFTKPVDRHHDRHPFSSSDGRTRLEERFEKLHQGMRRDKVEELIGQKPFETFKVDGEPDDEIVIWRDGNDRISTKFRSGRLVSFEGTVRGMNLKVH